MSAGLLPDALGELTALPQTPSWIMGKGKERGGKRAGGRVKEQAKKGVGEKEERERKRKGKGGVSPSE